MPAYRFLSQEIALLEERLANDRRTLGTHVFPGPTMEIDWYAVSLTEPGSRPALRFIEDLDASVLHWHGDTFDLPAGATLLAPSAHHENRAFAWGKRGLALPFHLEADPRQLKSWFVGHAGELAVAGIAVPAVRAATAAVRDRLHTQAQAIFTAWLATIE